MSNTATAMGAPAAGASTQTQTGAEGSQTDSVNTDSSGGEGGGISNVSRINPGKPTQKGAENPLLSQINELLSKNGGLQVTAGGKSHKIQTAKDLERYLQRGIPADKVMEEASKTKQEMQRMNAVIEKLRSGDINTKAQILESLLGKDALGELSLAQARRRFEAEEEQAKLTPRERQMAQELNAAKEKAAQFENLRKLISQQQEQAQHTQQVTQIRTQLEGAMAQALDLLQIPKENRKTMTRAVHLMQPLMKQMIDSGMPLDPQFLADRIRDEMSESFNFFTSSLEGDALLKFLGPDVGKKVRKAILAQLSAGQTPSPVAALKTATTQVQRNVQKNQAQSAEQTQWPSGRWVKAK